MISSRRKFLTGLGAVLITAPVIVRAGSLMPVKAMAAETDIYALLAARIREATRIMRLNMTSILYGDPVDPARFYLLSDDHPDVEAWPYQKVSFELKIAMIDP